MKMYTSPPWITRKLAINRAGAMGFEGGHEAASAPAGMLWPLLGNLDTFCRDGQIGQDAQNEKNNFIACYYLS